ncbi:hypothetical protein HK097_009388 [Rhizophlyctis rosea]|uniref:General stress protein FMN-binding split barrel domain-containing protein n=1 Tax=Rhizophlyctis rosea TaxID=64517 RepID=A0AAD5SC29_9FUNG|nr:hypothetical protein HK097_009388 [Rhizophlyctis rosea]
MSTLQQQNQGIHPAGGDATKQKNNQNDNASVAQQISDLLKLIDGIQTCMMTTRRADGQLVSRAMQTRSRDNAVDLWFVTNNQTHKMEELQFDPHVNLSFYKDGTSEWVSVSGVAKLSNDKSKIKDLWDEDLKAWFGDLGDGVHTGGPEDPRITLIFVEVQSAHYYLRDKSTPTVVYEVVKGAVTGSVAKVGPTRELGEGELDAARKLAQH